jgi:alkylation response protein AidB-like acyl-CoA dehydrogenase
MSIEQEAIGRLPAGLINEINNVRHFALKLIDEELLKRAIEIDRLVLKNSDYVDLSLIERFSKLGLYSKFIPRFLGGTGWHPLSFYFFNLEMAGACLGIANLLGPHYVAMGLLSATNSFTVLKKITNEILEAQRCGDHCTMAVAITEPNAGSDMEDDELITKADVMTIAKKVSGGYEISGQKIFISNAKFAKWYVVSAFTNKKSPADSLIMFVVRSSAKGITLGRTEKKLGQSASPASVVFFDKVFIADEDVTFSREMFKTDEDYSLYAKCLLNDLLSLSRAGVGALATGVQVQVINLVEKVKLKNDEWIIKEKSKLLSNLMTSKRVSWYAHIECFANGPYRDLLQGGPYYFFKYCPRFILKLLLSKSVQKKLRQKRLKMYQISNEKKVQGYGAHTKYLCSNLAMESIFTAQNLAGSHNPAVFFGLEKIARDAKLLQIYEGANELNQLLVAKSFLGDKDKRLEIFHENIA